MSWPRYFGSDPKPVAWRLDDQPVVHDTWDISASGKALGFFDGAQAKTLITRLTTGHRLVLQAAPYEAGPIEAVFDLDGIADVAAKTLAACP